MDQSKPRLVQVIEAGANGLLDEFDGADDLLERAFAAHEATCVCLDRGEAMQNGSIDTGEALLDMGNEGPENALAPSPASSMATPAADNVMAQFSTSMIPAKPAASGLDDLDLDSIIPPQLQALTHSIFLTRLLDLPPPPHPLLVPLHPPYLPSLIP